MNYLSFLIFSTILGLSVIFISCKKDKEAEPKQFPTNQTDQEGTSAIDDAIEDISDIISYKIGGGALHNSTRILAYELPCGIIKLDSAKANGKSSYTVHYVQSQSCGIKRKSGKISFHLTNGNAFDETNAVYSIVFSDYKVKLIASGREVTINGTVSVKNINGHYVWETVASNKTIKHKVRGRLLVTFENGEIREKNLYQLRTWVSKNGWQGLSFSIEGDTLNNISETGYTIDGNHYYQTDIIEAFTWSNCGHSLTGPFVLKKGRARMNVDYPKISNAFIDIEAGYYINTKKLTNTPTKTNDCEANTYKIFIQFAKFENTQYQLY